MKILLKAGIKKQLQSVIAVAILFMLMSIAIVTAVSMGENSKKYISSEMDRLGYGDETLWISIDNKGIDFDQTLSALEEEVNNLEEVSRVSAQKLIFAGYSVNDKSSDDEGQLILYEPENVQYRFLNDNADGYETVSEIQDGDIYVSAVMASNFKAKIGDTITFRLSRNGMVETFRIAGFFEDPFMGSSMIDMKGFLISKADYEKTIQLINETDSFNILARSGAMLHVFENQDSQIPASELSGMIQSQTSIGQYMEFTYSHASIEGFMSILQNIMVGFLIVFAAVLGLICAVIISHSISNSIEQDYKDMGILKTIGGNSMLLRILQMIPYTFGEFAGIIIGTVMAWTLSKIILQQMVYSTGLLIPGGISIIKSILIFILMIAIFLMFIYMKTKKIVNITPVRAIQGQIQNTRFTNTKSQIHASCLSLSYATRQIMADKKKYIGTVLVTFLLVCLVVIVGKMNNWLGSNGEGLMNSFSVAEHDLGVQPNHEFDMTQVENVIEKYASIQDTYELAMQNGTVNDVDYTINVLDKPQWFHIISGRTCNLADEILVTEYVASDLGVSIGDVVTVGGSYGNASYTIVGIYACANEMGANVGMTKDGFAKIGNVNSYIWCRHYILSDSTHNETIMKELQNLYPMDLDVHTNSWSGLDSIVTTLKLLTIVMYGIVFVVIVVVVMLTSSKFLQTEQKDMAILRSQGFTAARLRTAFMMRLGIASLIGMAMGCVISAMFADTLISMLLASFGISDFHTTFSLLDNILLPAVILLLFITTAFLCAGKIKKIDIVELMKGDL